jgi:hypothetical protein
MANCVRSKRLHGAMAPFENLRRAAGLLSAGNNNSEFAGQISRTGPTECGAREREPFGGSISASSDGDAVGIFVRRETAGDFYLLLAPGLTITASGQMTADRVSRETQQETGALVPLDQQRTLFRSAERTPREGRGTCKSMHAPLLLYAPHSCVTSTTSPATPLGVSSSSVYISTKTRPAWVASAPHKPRSSRAFDSYDPAEPSSPADPENDPITPCNAA